MFLKSICLKNFRNISNEKINLHPKFNLLFGSNAQGKTNVIEAISLLSTGSSFRVTDFRDLICWNSQCALITAISQSECGEDELRVEINSEKKTFYKNSKRTTPGGFEKIGVVLFAPEEIFLLRGSPAARRRYIDILISQVLPSYRSLIRKYERIVSQRNRFLKEAQETGRLDVDGIKIWDYQLVDAGSKLIFERNIWCERLNEYLTVKYAAVAPGDDSATFAYRPHCGEKNLSGGEESIKDALSIQLKDRQKDEIIRGITLAGPHRDDIEARIGNAPAKNFGSQGQHRTFVLSLKIAEMEMLKEIKGEAPILLLDDVASELDCDRNKFFFNYLNEVEGQVFITSTNTEDIRLGQTTEAKKFSVKKGIISPAK